MSTTVRQFSHLVCGVAALFVAAGSGALFGAAATAVEQAPGMPKQLLVTLHVNDKKNVPLTDLAASDLEVTENGQARPIMHAELDQRPLAVALVVDNNSELSTSFMQSVVPAAVAAIKALPPGTTIDVWSTGDRPTQVAKAFSDPAAAESALKGIGAIGSNRLLNTIVDASKALPSDEEHRTAVIILTSGSLGDPEGYGFDQARKVTSMRPTFVGLEVVVGQADSRVENALEYLANYTAGHFEKVLSVTALEKRAPALVAIINAQYRVAWQPGGDPRQTKYGFKSTRKGTKVVAAQRLSMVQ